MMEGKEALTALVYNRNSVIKRNLGFSFLNSHQVALQGDHRGGRIQQSSSNRGDI